MNIELELNGEEQAFEVHGNEALLETLRRNGYTGAKRGCNEGSCGFCTVIVDGEAEKSCLKPAPLADGATVETIEGLGTQDNLSPVQQAFVDNAALQCGYCIPGMIMTARSFLDSNPEPDDGEIRDALSSNLCRCTGYEKIVDAVSDAAERRRVDSSGTELATDGGNDRADDDPSEYA